jgi:ADP-heptose:LPS heptosyltransferase
VLSAVAFHLESIERLGWPAPPGVPSLRISEARREDARSALGSAGVPERARCVGFHPGARWPTRRWAVDRWVGLARRFLEETPEGFALISGGPDEHELVEGVITALPAGRAAPLVGWPIGRFVAVQACCAAFVSGDSGPLHTAVAAGAPTLGLFSRNSPAMFFPYPGSRGHRAYYARVECSPCHRDLCDDLRCLHRLQVEGAWTLLSGMLRRTSGV